MNLSKRSVHIFPSTADWKRSGHSHLRLIYIDEKDLPFAVRFVKNIRVEFQEEANGALYQDVCYKRHTEMPEILLLQRSVRQVLAGDGSEVLKQLDANCLKIVDRIVESV